MKKLTKVEKFLTKSMNNLADFIGKPQVFLGVLIISLAWFMARFFMDYEVWFDLMDMTIFIPTFLLLFVVQSSQNADTLAIQHKLDEIIDVLPGADTKKEGEEELLKRGEKK